MSVWARDGQAPARAQTHGVAGYGVELETGATWTVQYMHREAPIGIELRHSGQSRVVAAFAPWMRTINFAIGATIRK